MKQDQTDSLVGENENKESTFPVKQDNNKKGTAIVQEREGSIQSIEIPAEKNSFEIIKTEKEIEEENKKSDLDLDPTSVLQKKISKIPLDFLFHIQVNKAKYVF